MRNSLRRIEGVRQVEVDLDEKTASVIVVKSLDTAVLVAAMTNIGFPSVIRVAE